MKKQKSGFGAQITCEHIRNAMIEGRFGPKSIWSWEYWKHMGRSGSYMLVDEWIESNIMVNQGLDYMLDSSLSNGSQFSTFYVGLFNDDYTPISPNTYATPGFTESTDYSGGVRPTWSDGGVAGQCLSNAASKASFTMGGTDDIYGAFLCSYVSPGDKTHAGAKLICSSKFASAKTGIDASDILKVQIKISAQDV